MKNFSTTNPHFKHLLLSYKTRKKLINWLSVGKRVNGVNGQKTRKWFSMRDVNGVNGVNGILGKLLEKKLYKKE